MNRVLKKRLRNGLILAFYGTGLASLWRWWMQIRHGRLARVLCFHWIGPEGAAAFEAKMRWLQANFDVVPLAEIVANDCGTADRMKVAVTFDDGFRDLKEVVLPIIKRLGIPITVFVPAAVLTLGESERRQFAVQCIGIDRPLLSIDELKQLASDSLVTIGSHSDSHADLGAKLTTEKLRLEIQGSVEQISTAISVRARFLAYPFGDVFNYSNAAMSEAERAGIEGAFSIEPGFIHQHRNRYSLPRDSLDPNMSPLLFKAWLGGAYDIPKAISNWGRVLWAQ